MSRLREIDSKAVLPGDPICVLEEFIPGASTYEEKGVVRSLAIGRVATDLKLRVVHVKSLVRRATIPSKGSYVYGVVQVVRDEHAIVKLVADSDWRGFNGYFTGVLHISQASDKYVSNLYEVLRAGDIIKARVYNSNLPFNIGLKEPRLGVVLAFCGKCGRVLKAAGPDTLKCPYCGNLEKRKLSIEYGNLKGLMKW